MQYVMEESWGDQENMSKEQIQREALSDRYYEWIRWKGTRHEKECLEDLSKAISILKRVILN